MRIVKDSTGAIVKISTAAGTLIPSTGGVSDGDKGDITVTGGGSIWTINDGAVTNEKIDSVEEAKVTLDKLSGANITTLDILSNYEGSTITLSGGGFTDNGDGTIAVAAGNGQIRATDSVTAQLLQVSWGAVASLALTDQEVNFIYLEYNAGTPQVVADLTPRTDLNTNIFLGTSYREGTVARLYGAKRFYGGNHSQLIARRLQNTDPFAHESGGMISGVGTLNIAITAGVFWEGVDQFLTAAFDSSASVTFDYYYRSATPGLFTKVSGQTQIDNTQYDDGSGTLQPLGNNRYTNAWVYLGAAGAVYILYGRIDSPNEMGAEAAPQPDSVPEVIQYQARLIGRVIVQEGNSSFIQVESAFNQTFNTAGVINHNELSGLQGGAPNEYYHLTSAEYTVVGNTSGTNTGDQTSVSGNAGTATTLQTSRKIDGVSFDGSANIVVNNLINIYSTLGGSVKAEPFWGSAKDITANLTLATQRLYLVAIWLPEETTLTGISYFQGTQGIYTPSNYNGVVIYPISGGTLTLGASSTDDGNIWKATANSFNKKAFSAPYVASGGLYFLGALWSSSATTTAPTLGSGAGTLQGATLTQDFPNSVRLNGFLNSQTSLPASQAMSGISNHTTKLYLGVY